jgi:hypothetical protein
MNPKELVKQNAPRKWYDEDAGQKYCDGWWERGVDG